MHEMNKSFTLDGSLVPMIYPSSCITSLALLVSMDI